MHMVIFCWLMTYILHSWRIFCIGNSWRIFCIVPLSFDICRYHIQCRYQSHVPCDLIRYGAAGMNVSDYISSHVTCVMSHISESRNMGMSHVPCDFTWYGAAGMNVSDYISGHVTCHTSVRYVTWEWVKSHVTLLDMVPREWMCLTTCRVTSHASCHVSVTSHGNRSFPMCLYSLWCRLFGSHLSMYDIHIYISIWCVCIHIYIYVYIII